MKTLKHKRSGQFYMTVESNDMNLEDGQIAVCPYGGGFIGRAKADDFIEAEIPNDLVDGIADIDGEGNYPCVFNPHERWNGWACPHFTREVMEQIAREWGMTVVKVEDDEYLHDPEYSDDPQDGIPVIPRNGFFELNGVCWDCEETVKV